MKRRRIEIRKWYRYEFKDGSFIYLVKSFRSLKVLYREMKEHGRVVKRIEVGVRTL